MRLLFKKILLIQTAFIGDVILASGMIEKLKEYYPEAKIDVLIKKENHSILSNHPFINHLYLFNKSFKYKEMWRLIREIRNEQYDLVINLHRFGSSGIIAGLSGGKARVGFKKNPFSFLNTKSFHHSIGEKDNYRHEVERNHSLIKNFADSIPAKPKLHLQSIDLENVKKYQNSNYICIAPASVWFTKQFPISKWIDFIKLLPDNFQIYLLGGPGDQALLSDIVSSLPQGRIISLAGKLSLIESAALMKGALLNFVNDSGPLHLASAVNANVCAIFCSTIPAFGFGPLSDFSRIVEIDYNLHCRPCNLHGFKICPEGHFKCGNDINIQKLLQVFQEVLLLKS